MEAYSDLGSKINAIQVPYFSNNCIFRTFRILSTHIFGQFEASNVSHTILRLCGQFFGRDSRNGKELRFLDILLRKTGLKIIIKISMKQLLH